MKVHPKATTPKIKRDTVAHEKLAQLAQESAAMTGPNHPEYAKAPKPEKKAK
jgi:hypothetical protein